nr:ribonuclease H-like domain-containing protein [Tanacetum cinerariifolium]
MSVHGYTDNEFDAEDDNNITLISKLDVSNPLHLHPNDTVALTVIFVKLKGTKNYQVLSCAMLLALNGINKTGFIDGSCRRFICYAADNFKIHNQLMKLMQFLMGLDDTHMQIKSSILSRETLPDVRSAYATISSEKSHRVASGNIFETSQGSQTSAYSANVHNRVHFKRSQTSDSFPRLFYTGYVFKYCFSWWMRKRYFALTESESDFPLKIKSNVSLTEGEVPAIALRREKRFEDNQSSTFVVSSVAAPNQHQQHTTPLNIHTTPAPTCQVPTLAPIVTSSKNINQAENDQVADDEFINIFCTPIQDQGETSSRHVDSSNMHTFYQRYPSEHRWTKDHPLKQVIRNPSQSVRTRRQLELDVEMCMFALTVSRTEPKKIKEAMADSAWIESMQEELHQFDRLNVWELVDRPLCTNVINLKWL